MPIIVAPLLNHHGISVHKVQKQCTDTQINWLIGKLAVVVI